MTSGHLKETIMRVYDVRPSTAEFMMEVLETIDQAIKNEYHRGWIEGQGALRKELLSAEPKKGKWMPNSFFKDEPSTWKCSCCGAIVYRTDECNYCYNCGAEMEE